MNFRIGQEVACIDDDPWFSLATGGPTSGPRKGEVAVILQVAEQWSGTYLELTGWPGQGFHAANFRPLVRTDISVFTAMLALTPKQKEVERV